MSGLQIQTTQNPNKQAAAKPSTNVHGFGDIKVYLQQLLSKKPLDIWHMDFFGPSRIASLGGIIYALVIVDDFSRFTWNLFITSKSDAFDVFKKLAKVL